MHSSSLILTKFSENRFVYAGLRNLNEIVCLDVDQRIVVLQEKLEFAVG